MKKLTIPVEEDKMAIIDTGYEHVRSVQNAYAVQKKDKVADGEDPVEFDENLGLACEKLP